MAFLYNPQKEGSGIYKDGKKGFSNCLSILFSKVKELILSNLLYFAFLLPFVALSAIIAYSVFPDTGVLKNINVQFTFQIMLLALPFAFSGPVTAGFTRIIRDIGREEHSFIWKDFISTVKRCFRKSIIVSIISYVFYMSAFFAFLVYWGSWVFFAVALITTLYYSVMEKYMYLMTVSLDLSVLKMIKNSFFLILASFKKSMAALIANIISVALFISYILFVAYMPTTIVFFILLLLFFQFSFPSLFSTYYCFNVIIEKVVDPYYEEINNSNADDSIVDKTNNKNEKYVDENNISEHSDYVYENGKLVRRDIIEQEQLFKDN